MFSTMRTLIILMSAVTLLFASCDKACFDPVYDATGNFVEMQEVDCNSTTNQLPRGNECATSYMLGQPTSGAVRTIQVDTQGYLNGNDICVFDLSLYEAGLPITPTNIEWTINDRLVTIGQSFVTIEVPAEYTVVCVNYMVGSQVGADCRSFLP